MTSSVPAADPVLPPPAAVDAGGGPDEEAPTALRRVLLNALALLGAYALPRAFTFAAAVVAARALGVATFGAYGTAAAIAVILSVVATLGMMQLLVRELAREPERAPELVGAAHLAKTASGVIMLLVLWGLVAGPLGFPPEVRTAALLLGVGYAVGAYAENLGAYFQGVERMGVWMEAQALFGVVTGAAGIALALGTRSLVWFCTAPVLGQAAAVAWLLLRAPGPVRRAWRAPPRTVWWLVRSLIPFAVAFVALTAYYKVDILLLERWRGDAEAGLYAAAYKFVDVAQALALVAATALYPRLSRAGAALAQGRAGGLAGSGGAEGPRSGGSDGNGHRWAAARAAELILLAGVPGAAVLWLLREPVMGLLFGPEYGGSVVVLAFLAPVLPALALNMLGTFVLAARERMGTVAALYAGGFVVMVALNRLLIPGLGARGAALAMLCSEFALALVMLAALGRRASAAPAPRILGAVGVVAASAALLSLVPLSPAAAAVGCLAVTGVAYALVRAVPSQEWRILREAVRA